MSLISFPYIVSVLIFGDTKKMNCVARKTIRLCSTKINELRSYKDLWIMLSSSKLDCRDISISYGTR